MMNHKAPGRRGDGLTTIPWACLALACATLLVGCKTAPPDYARELAPGEPALRWVTGPTRAHILGHTAGQLGDRHFRTGLDRSAAWFALPSSRQWFPVEGVTFRRAQASVGALREIAGIADPQTRRYELDRRFDVFESVGYDGSGTVLFTGYFSPTFSASKVRQGPYQHPVYRRPPDLVTDPRSGAVLGKRTERGLLPYETRRQLETTGKLRGLELVYFLSRLDAYTVEVNGSAKLDLVDGSTMYIGYDGTNGHEYTSVGQQLVAAGALDRNTVSMPTIRNYFQSHPYELDRYIQLNDRFVFFKEYEGTDWPAGSLGFRVTPMRSVATDKAIFPRGGAVVASTTLPDGAGGGGRPLVQLMLDQDTGGAIRAPGRADLYIGLGDAAEHVAGRMAAEGRLFYLFLKPELVEQATLKLGRWDERTDRRF